MRFSKVGRERKSFQAVDGGRSESTAGAVQGRLGNQQEGQAAHLRAGALGVKQSWKHEPRVFGCIREASAGF